MPRRSDNDWLIVAVILAAAWWVTSKGVVIVPPVPVVKATAATFVYEKSDHVVPSAVLSALNKLNREKGIIATVFEEDTTDGTGEVPTQYQAALAAAKAAGLPALVVTAGKDVLRVVKNPKTGQEVLEAVP